MSRFPLTVAWLCERTRLEPALLASRAFEDSLGARLREIGLADDAAYVARLAADERERRHVQTLVAVPETWLFRTRASFEWLRERLSARRRERGGTPLRMLSVACANGAEPHSMAATALAAGFAADTFRIDAIEVSDAALVEARRGKFRGFAIRDPLPSWAGDFFTGVPDGMEAGNTVRESIRFIHADVFAWREPAGERYHVIFCRNLMIYLATAGRAELVRRLVDWLEPDGVLVVGHADACPELLASFRGEGPAGAFAYLRGTAPVERPAVPRRESASDVPPRRPAATVRPPSSRAKLAPAAEATVPAAVPDLGEIRRLLAEDRGPEAAESLSRLLRIRPDLSEAHCLSGELALAGGGLAAAGDSFRKALYLDPGCEQALIRLAEVAERLGRPDEADRYRERALRIHLDRENAGGPEAGS